MPAVDAILKEQGGRRIGDLNVLGTITVETTAGGTRKLARAPEVMALLEDQEVLQIR